MYESPIKVFQGNLEMQFEGEILKAVQRANITVDRDELIRALRYDREQYQKGFDDARKDAVPVVYGRWEMRPTGMATDTDPEYKAYCTVCNEPNKQYQPPFCPHCGAKMDGGGKNG